MLPIKAPTPGKIYGSDIEAPLSEVVSAQAKQAWTENPSVAAWRMWSGRDREDDKISFDQARAMVSEAGLDGQLEVSSMSTPSRQAIELLIERKKDELKRADIMSRGPSGGLAATAQLGTAFAVTMLDPVNIGVSFVPIAGEAKWAKAAQASKSALTRAAGRFGVGAIEGAVGAAAVEPIIYASKQMEQADYDVGDSFMNVAFGTVFGGGLHTTFGAIGDAFKSFKAPERLPTRDAEIRADAARSADLARSVEFEPSREPAGAPDEIGKIADDAVAARSAGEIGDAQKIANVLPLNEAEAVYRAAIGQAADGRPIDVEDIVSPYSQKTSDGIAVHELDPVKFEPKNIDIDGLIAREQQRARDIPQPAERVKLLEEAKQAEAEGRELTPPQKEAVRQSITAKAIDEGLPVPDRYAPKDMKQLASANRGKFTKKMIERRSEIAAKEAAQQEEVARAIAAEPVEQVPTSTMSEEIDKLTKEIDEVESQSKILLDSLGQEPDEAMKMADDLIKKADKWAKIADTAQLCVLRGG